MEWLGVWRFGDDSILVRLLSEQLHSGAFQKLRLKIIERAKKDALALFPGRDWGSGYQEVSKGNTFSIDEWRDAQLTGAAKRLPPTAGEYQELLALAVANARVDSRVDMASLISLDARFSNIRGEMLDLIANALPDWIAHEEDESSRDQFQLSEMWPNQRGVELWFVGRNSGLHAVIWYEGQTFALHDIS